MYFFALLSFTFNFANFFARFLASFKYVVKMNFTLIQKILFKNRGNS